MRMDGQEESSNVEDVRGMGAVAAADSASAAAASASAAIVIARDRRLDLRHQPADAARHDERRRRRPRWCSSRRRRPRRRPTTTARASSRRCLREHRSTSGRDVFQRSGQHLPARPSCVLFRGSCADRLRPGPGGDGAVLLPGRPEGLHRPALLPVDTRAEASARRATSRRRTSIAHKVGHHVQALDRHHRQGGVRSGSGEAEGTRSPVRLRAQADFFAGVFAAPAQRSDGWCSNRALRGGAGRGRADRRRHAAARGARHRCSRLFTRGTPAQRMAGSSAAANTAASRDATPSTTRAL